MAQVIRRLRDEFSRYVGDSAGLHIACAPGRVNLLGEHTDYNDGYVLPTTIDRAVWLALRRRDDRTVRLRSVNFDESIDYPLTARPQYPPEAWSSYVSGTVEELRARGLIATGFEGVVFGDVPLGAGLSSSAALEVATVVALQHLFDFELDAVASAQLCQQVEHRYAGVQCGIMDQFVVRLGRKDHVLFLDCRDLAHELIPVSLAPAGLCVVIVNSGVGRALAGSKYNERRGECEEGVRYFRKLDPSIGALRDVTLDLFERHERSLPNVVAKRCRHVLLENQRVLTAAGRLRRGEWAAFGGLMDDSHASLRDLYEVSCTQLDELVTIAQDTRGVLGSRMTGAGFGGCTVHLVEEGAIAHFEERMRRLYEQRCGLVPSILVQRDNVSAGPCVK